MRKILEDASVRASFYEGAGWFRTGSAAVPPAAAGEALLGSSAEQALRGGP